MKKLIVFFGSEQKTNRQERRKAREELRQGKEPQPKYRTGKFWVD